LSNLRAQIAGQIRTDILEQRIPVGEILLEKKIAAQFDVSKTPVREALALLCEEGLVQLFPRRGYVVRGLTLKEVVDTFDLRAILEGAAAERAVAHLTEDQLLSLESLAQHDCCGEVDARVSHRLEIMRHSLDFHVAIARASGNDLLAEQIEKLLRASRRITSIGFTYGDHQQICAALRARDAAGARRAMEKHILSGREVAIRALAGQPHNHTGGGQ
jgi:GntR family transcriptional regulator, rspAB operon transcriptional repressor